MRLSMETNLNVVLPLPQRTSISEVIYLFYLFASSYLVMAKFFSLSTCYYSDYTYLSMYFSRKISKVIYSAEKKLQLFRNQTLSLLYIVSFCKLCF